MKIDLYLIHSELIVVFVHRAILVLFKKVLELIEIGGLVSLDIQLS